MPKIFCDFDGTITMDCSVTHVLQKLADSTWENIEEAWVTGKIGSAECMQRQIALISASKSKLDEVLDEVKIDPSFLEFAEYCQALDYYITIISDGVDYFIQRILNRYNIFDLPIIANQLHFMGNNTYRLTCPYASGDGAGTCKSTAIAGQKVIFIGDGRSDFTVASQSRENMLQLFTKAKLTTYCQQNNIAHTVFQNFHDIIREFQLINPPFLLAQTA